MDEIDTIDIEKEHLTAKASKGAFWNILSQTMVSAIRFIVTAVLARILVPAEFGLLGMAALITGIVALFGNLGLGAALVQRKDVDDEYLSTGFWASVVMGCVLTVIGIGVSPLAAKFFHEPLVQWIICALSINFFFSFLTSIHAMMMYRDLRFKEIALIEISSTILRVALVLLLAFSGFGVWSIILGIIFERIIKTLFFFIKVRWRPLFIFHKEKFWELFHFGKNLYGASFIGYFNRSMDYIVTGRFLGAIELGYYQFAYNIPHLVNAMITMKIHDVLFPIYSKIQDDNKRLARGFIKAVSLISTITFPILFGLFITADSFILTVYGIKWYPAIIPLRILCISGAIYSVTSLCGSLITAKGRPDINFKVSLSILPVAVCLIIFFSRWGLNGIAIAMVILSTLSFIHVYIAVRLIHFSILKYLKALIPAFVCSLCMIIVLYGIDNLVFTNCIYPAAHLILNILTGVAIYILALRYFYPENFNNIIAISKLVLKRNRQ